MASKEDVIRSFSLEVIITEVTETHATPDHDSTTE
jgi:hypothetical protein